MSLPFLSLVLLACFLGNVFLYSANDNGNDTRLRVKDVVAVLIGGTLSLFVPPIMLLAWFKVVVWFRTLS